MTSITYAYIPRVAIWFWGQYVIPYLPRVLPALRISHTIARIDVRGRPPKQLDHPYDVWFSLDSLYSKTPTNRAISKLCQNNPPEAWHWYGTVVVLKFSSVQRVGYQDVCEGDVDVLKAWFSTSW